MNQFSRIEYMVTHEKAGKRRYQRVLTTSGRWVASVIDHRGLKLFMEQLNQQNANQPA